MQVHSFIAETVQDALAQIREQLGAEAVVLHVRPVPAAGLSRLWQKPRLEVLAGRPESPTPAIELNQFRSELADLRQKLEARGQGPGLEADDSAPARPLWNRRLIDTGMGGWVVGALLETTGVLPVHAQRVVEELIRLHGEQPPESLAAQIQFGRQVLEQMLAGKVPSALASGVHVFVGAPGVGKTTCLCKWLAKTVLVESRSASTWRLDSRVANTAEALSVYCEILDVPLARCWSDDPERWKSEVLFVDLPGVNWRNDGELSELAELLRRFADPQIHLVLNAGYEMDLILDQVRAFAPLPISDLIVSHLDEDPRWGKLWNLVLGTKFPLRYLSAGQNIPGDFEPLSAQAILNRQFPSQ